jgi:glycosyltransferase involved in cell wall biosynthesis
LAARLRAFGVDPNDVFLGDLPLDAVSRLYRQAAVVVFPSLLETFGLPLIEAMASGTPVIAADGSSTPEIVGDAAELFDPHSSDALRAAIEALLSDVRKRADLVNKGYRRAEQFAWSKTAARMLEVFSIASRVRRTRQTNQR